MIRFFTGLAAVAALFTAHAYADNYGTPSGVTPENQFITPLGAAEGGVDIYTNQADFELAALGQGKLLKFVETFEEATTPAGTVGSSFPAPLSPGVPAGDFPNGLAAPNIRINCEDTSGDNFCDLITLGANFLPGLQSTVLGPNSFGDTLVIETLPGFNKTAIGFEIDDPGLGTPDYDLTVTDTGGTVLFSGTLIGVGAVDGFIGLVTSGVGIGSISVNGVGGGGELIDNIQLYAPVPEPSGISMLLLALICGMRRLRRG